VYSGIGDTGRGLPGVRAVNTGDYSKCRPIAGGARTPAAATAEATPTFVSTRRVAATPRPAEATSVCGADSLIRGLPFRRSGWRCEQRARYPANNHPSASDSGLLCIQRRAWCDVGVVASTRRVIRDGSEAGGF